MKGKRFEKAIEVGAEMLQTTHKTDGIPVNVLQSLLIWIPADPFWSRAIKTLSTMRKAVGGAGGPMKYENALSRMSEHLKDSPQGRGLHSYEEMIDLVNEEKISTSDFVEVKINGGLLWRRKKQ